MQQARVARMTFTLGVLACCANLPAWAQDSPSIPIRRWETGTVFIDGVPVSPGGRGGQFVGISGSNCQFSLLAFEDAQLLAAKRVGEELGIDLRRVEYLPNGSWISEGWARIYRPYFLGIDPWSTMPTWFDASPFMDFRDDRDKTGRHLWNSQEVYIGPFAGSSEGDEVVWRAADLHRT